MTGFVEILSDPSYINQIVTFTSSHVGNYGMSQRDFESNMPKIEAAIGNSFTDFPSSWRSEKSITSWLKEYDIPYSGGFDVRNITKYLRDNGSSMFALGVDIDIKELKDILYKAKDILGDNSAMTAGNQEDRDTSTDGKIGIMDLGAKKSIVNVLEDHDYKVVMISPTTSVLRFWVFSINFLNFSKFKSFFNLDKYFFVFSSISSENLLINLVELKDLSLVKIISPPYFFVASFSIFIPPE